jgi:hypothetical protein
MPEYTSDYFLMAELYVTEENHLEFEKQFREFMVVGGFRRFSPADFSLVFGLRTPRAQRFESSGFDTLDADDPKSVPYVKTYTGNDALIGRAVYRYVHFWSMPSLDVLNVAAVMNASAEDEQYSKLDALVGRETQEFMVRVRWPWDSPSLPMPPDSGDIIRVVSHFTSSGVNNYLYNGVPATLPILNEYGWTDLGFYQQATGLLDTVVELWHSSSNGGAAHDIASMDRAFPSLMTNAAGAQAAAPTAAIEAAKWWQNIKATSMQRREILMRYI